MIPNKVLISHNLYGGEQNNESAIGSCKSFLVNQLKTLNLINAQWVKPGETAFLYKTPFSPKGGATAYLKKLVAENLNHLKQNYNLPAYALTIHTSVVKGNKMYPLPSNYEEAIKLFKLLSGTNHRVVTALTGFSPNGESAPRLVSTVIKLKKLDEKTLHHLATIYSGGTSTASNVNALSGTHCYLTSVGHNLSINAPCYIRSVIGCCSNIFGLPLPTIKNIVCGLGFPTMSQ